MARKDAKEENAKRTIHSLVVQYKLDAQASGLSDWVRGQFTRLRFELVFAHGAKIFDVT